MPCQDEGTTAPINLRGGGGNKRGESEQVLRRCAIEARFRLLQVCNPLVSTWLKQRLTLHRKAAGDSSMT
jgi:hypothetical protein